MIYPLSTWKGIYRRIITVLLSIIGMYEFYRAVRKKEYNPIDIIGYILLILYYVLGNNFE